MKLPKSDKNSWTLQSGGSACVIVDMQRAFVDEGAPLQCVGAPALVPGINRLTALCRSLEIPVIFIKANRRADGSDSGLMRDMSFQPENDLDPLEGKRGAEFCDGLKIDKTDYIVPKVRYSAFLPGTSQLESLLRGLGINTIIICGVATDVCVGTNTMEGMMLGYRMFLVGDLCATFSEERHRIALQVYDLHCARVTTLAEVEKLLKGPPG